MKVIMATKNKNKIREVREILEGTEIEVVSMADAGIDIEIEESGKTFEENAIIKAEAIKNLTNEIVMADDSGLIIDAMPNELGVYSARFMGEDTSYEIKNKEILNRLEGLPNEKRSARFVCTIAIAIPNKDTKIFKGVIEGYIALEATGDNGFGYDPIFYVPELGRTTAQLTEEEKNKISHRGKALAKAADELKKIIL